jgi:sialate O-acetylesterase
MTKRLIRRAAFALLALLIAGQALSGECRLAGCFGDSMVLQRDKPVPVWGWADPGAEVTVEFGGQKVSARADAHGKWIVRLTPMKASAKGTELVVGKKIRLKNVVVGDVWLCSGQSNMEWPQRATVNAAAEAAAARTPLIRHLKIGHVVGDRPRRDVRATWVVCSPRTVGRFTAVGYYFARELHKKLEVPVGLIGSNWGGTRVEPWTAPQGFRLVPGLKNISEKVDATLPSTELGEAAYRKVVESMKVWTTAAEAALEKKKWPPPAPRLPTLGTSHQDPTRIYNGMIHPLVPFAIRGTIWYQGESNGSEGNSYFLKKRALIEGWRQLWGQGDFPFYFVQLANFKSVNKRPAGGDGWARLREAQRKTLTIRNTGMAVTIDIGEARNIHPKNKQDVGLRLALWALAKEYGVKDLVYSGPLYKSHAVEGKTVRLSFEHTGSGLIAGSKKGLAPAAEVKDGKLTWFAVAGKDKVWHWADARIDGKTVIVSSAAVPTPLHVRYAFAMNPQGCNLYNKEGLPASPFRTDAW